MKYKVGDIVKTTDFHGYVLVEIIDIFNESYKMKILKTTNRFIATAIKDLGDTTEEPIIDVDNDPSAVLDLTNKKNEQFNQELKEIIKEIE